MHECSDLRFQMWKLRLAGEAPSPGPCVGQLLPWCRVAGSLLIRFPEDERVHEMRKCVPTNLTAGQSNDDAKALSVTRHKLFGSLCFLSPFLNHLEWCLICTWNPRPSLPACPEVKPCPNSPPMDHGVNSQRENRNRTLTN